MRARHGAIIGALLVFGVLGTSSNAAVTCTWTKDTTATTRPLAILSDVSAESADSAWAVGAYYNTDIGDVVGHIQEWNGTEWTEPTLPAHVGSHEQLGGVARIPGTTEAWAVGYSRFPNDTERALIMKRTDAGWESVPIPDINGGLTAVAARSATDAWAVGWRNNGSGWIVHWDGVAWTTSASPTASVLTGITALGPDRAWAVGWSEGPLDTTLSLRWNGTSWQRVAVPDVANQKNYLRDVERIPGTSNLWAVGYRKDPDVSSFGKTLIVKWNGTAWKIVTSPTVGYTLEAVTPVTGTQAWAFGTRKTSTGRLRGLILSWNGTAWSRITEPAGTLWFEGSTRVPGSTRIWAVGEYPGVDDDVPVIIRGCG